MSTVRPRPEYPRPQFVRADWLNLNGAWEFSFDDSDRGVVENWNDGRQLLDRIVVPFPYQSALSGINDQGIHEVVWYAHSLIVPPEWCDQDVLLHFGAVDYRTTVWLNGAEVGHNQGGHVPFWFDLTPLSWLPESSVRQLQYSCRMDASGSHESPTTTGSES